MLFLPTVGLLSAILFHGIWAQILHTTPLWDTNVTHSHTDRVNAASAALSQVVNRLGDNGRISVPIHTTFADTPHFYEALANYNIMTRQQNLSEVTMSFMRGNYHLIRNDDNTPGTFFGYLREIIQLGYTAARTYISLQDDILLDLAKRCWDIMSTFTISDSDVQLGRISVQPFSLPHSVKTFSLPQACGSRTGNFTLAGAAFQNESPQSSAIDVYETASFFLFSSIMASLETPPNSTYVSAARASLDFIMQFQPSAITNSPSLKVGVDLDHCGNISIAWPGGTSTAGFVIEGVSILAVLEDDDDLHKLLLETIQKTFVFTTLGWPSLRGILSNYHNQTTSPPSLEVLPDVVARDIEFVRGLAVAYRNATSLPSDVRDAIKAFLGVQYNAVRNLAAIGDDLYDGSWQDPGFRTYSPSFDIVNQSFAAQVLIDGIDIFDEPPPPTRVPVATLAGSIVGGVLFLAILIALAAFFYRRRQSAAADNNTNDSPSLFFSSSAIFDGHNVEVTPFEWDPEWYRDRPIQNTKKRPLATVDQNLNSEPVPDQVAPSPGEPLVVGTPPVDDDSDSPPEYRSQ